MRHFRSLFIDTHKKLGYVTPADVRTAKTGVLFCHFHLFSKPMDILYSRLFPVLHLVCFESCPRRRFCWLGFNGVYQFL